MSNEQITAAAIEAAEFPDLVERYKIQGVPKTVMNESVEFVGALPEAQALEHLLRAAQ